MSGIRISFEVSLPTTSLTVYFAGLAQVAAAQHGHASTCSELLAPAAETVIPPQIASEVVVPPPAAEKLIPTRIAPATVNHPLVAEETVIPAPVTAENPDVVQPKGSTGQRNERAAQEIAAAVGNRSFMKHIASVLKKEAAERGEHFSDEDFSADEIVITMSDETLNLIKSLEAGTSR